MIAAWAAFVDPPWVLKDLLEMMLLPKTLADIFYI